MILSDNDIVVLAVGANINAEANVSKAIQLLRHHISSMHYSNPTWTKPIGIASDDFLNCVITGVCDIEYPSLLQLTKEIEKICGDSRKQREKGAIAMDVDILLHHGKKYHPKDWGRQYIIDGIREISAYCDSLS